MNGFTRDLGMGLEIRCLIPCSNGSNIDFISHGSKRGNSRGNSHAQFHGICPRKSNGNAHDKFDWYFWELFFKMLQAHIAQAYLTSSEMHRFVF